jgi:hypothetical protein
MRRALLILILLTLNSVAGAHTSSSGFLVVRVEGQRLSGSVELALRDAELAVGIDANGDGKITWGELRAHQRALVEYVARHLDLGSAGRSCTLNFGDLQVNTRVDGNYAWLPFTARCTPAARELTVRYSLMAGIDPSHRGLLTLTTGATTQPAVLGGSRESATFALGRADRWRAFGEYLQAGIWHILSGIDHLLFLLSLLLPAVLARRGGEWQPVSAARPALLSVLKVVTAFTLAHSITLSLAALDVVRLPSRLTESVIAASIVVAALNNVFPLVTESRARIAFGFGLLHGFGFASVLAEMGLPAGARLLSLLSFNLGIEVGQIAVVLCVMPLVYRARGATVYRQAVLPLASAAIASIGLAWFLQRALGVTP